MNDIKFKSLNELYERIYPALNTKVNMLKNEKIIVSENDIWLYLKDIIWNKSNNLNLYKMVDDILNIDKESLIKYIDSKR